MRRTGVLLLLGAVLGALVVLGATPAQACSCAGGTAAQFAERADAVFTGRLVSRDVPRELRTSADPALHVFAVDAVAKGAVSERQEVLSPVSGASCGLELTGGGPVAVFATRTAGAFPDIPTPELEDDQYFAYLCGGTAPLTPQLEADLGPLRPVAADPGPAVPGPAVPVRPRAASTTSPDRDGPSALLLLGGGAVLLGAGALLLRRRRAR
jgi:LPXTG-motif cell wall-anchored protein